MARRRACGPGRSARFGARREAWQAWDESCKPAAKTTRRLGGTGPGGTSEANEVKGQCGNPAFLEKVYDGIRLEARITGTEAPQKQTIDGELRVEAELIARLDRAKLRARGEWPRLPAPKD